MKLRSLLRKQPRNVLEGIIQTRQLDIPNIEDLTDLELVEGINNALKKDDQIKFCLQRVERGARHLFDFIALYGGMVPEKEVVERFYGGDRRFLKTHISDLRSYALGFNESARIAGSEKMYCVIPDQYLKYILVPRFAVKRLGHLLTHSSLGQLKSMAFDGLGLRPKSSVLEELVALVQGELLTPDKLKKHIEKLPFSKRIFLQILVEMGGEADVDDIRKRFGEVEGLDVRSFEDIFEELLWREGFLFLEDAGQRNVKRKEHARVVSIPIEVYTIVKNGFKETDLSPLGLMNFLLHDGIKSQPLKDESFQPHLDLAVLLAVLASTDPQAFRKENQRKAAFEKVGAMLPCKVPREYLEFLFLFAEQKAIVQEQEGCWLLDPDFPIRLENPWGILEELFRFWSEMPRWQTLVDSSSKQSKAAMAVAEEGPGQARVFLSELLSHCEVSRPFDLGQFLQLVFDKTSLLPNAVTSSSSMYGTFSMGLAGLNTAELKKAFLGVFKWLGLVKATQDADGKITCLLTPQGLRLLGLQEPEKTETREPFDRFRFTESGALEAPLGVSPRGLVEMAQFTHLEQAGNPAVFVINDMSITTGIERGWKPDTMASILESSATGKFPETARKLLESFKGRQSEVEMIPTAGIVKTKEPPVFEMLVSSPEVNEFLQPAMTLENPEDGSRYLVLAEGSNIHLFLKTLRKLGYLPSIPPRRTIKDGEERFVWNLTPSEASWMGHALSFIQNASRKTNIVDEDQMLDHLAGLLEGQRLPDAPAFFTKLADLYTEKVSASAPKAGEEKPPASAKEEPSPMRETSLEPLLAGKGSIREFIEFAAGKHRKIRIRYNTPQEEGGYQEHLIIPNYVLNSFLNAFCCNSQSDKVFYLEKIEGAEFAPED